MTKTVITEKSRLENIPLLPGDKIKIGDPEKDRDYGVGIVVGFSENSGLPVAYFYSMQDFLTVGYDVITRIA
jgi:hypothetical protein